MTQNPLMNPPPSPPLLIDHGWAQVGTDARTVTLSNLARRFGKTLVIVNRNLIEYADLALKTNGMQTFRMLGDLLVDERGPMLDRFNKAETGAMIATLTACRGFHCNAQAVVLLDCHLNLESALFWQSIYRAPYAREVHFVNCDIKHPERVDRQDLTDGGENNFLPESTRLQ